MIVVFISNFYTHHQAPFSEVMNRLTAGNYYFIATEHMSKERVNMGWNINELPTYVKFYYKNGQERNECQNLINKADVVINGLVYNKLIKDRLKQGKITFKYSERLLKKYSLVRFCAYTIRNWLINGWYDCLYMLCASAYAASDYHRMHSFRNKCFKWGYFPQLKQYDDVNLLFSRKQSSSILWVARLIELKHPEYPLQIVKRLKNEGYKINLSLIGNGPLKEKLETFVKQNELDHEVNFIGSLTPKEVRVHMEKSAIFLFTSDRNEGWGAVLNEAMNSGCAVVASHEIGSVPFLLKDGENGLIYKDGDLNELYSKTKWLLDHQQEREKIGRNAYVTISHEWCAEKAAERFLHLVHRLQKGDDSPYITGPCSRSPLLHDDWK